MSLFGGGARIQGIEQQGLAGLASMASCMLRSTGSTVFGARGVFGHLPHCLAHGDVSNRMAWIP